MRNNPKEDENKQNTNLITKTTGLIGGIKNTLNNVKNYLRGASLDGELGRIEEERVVQSNLANSNSITSQLNSNRNQVNYPVQQISQNELKPSNTDTRIEKKETTITSSHLKFGRGKFSGFGVSNKTCYEEAWPKIDKILQEKYQESNITYRVKNIDNLPGKQEIDLDLDQIEESFDIKNKKNYSMNELNKVQMEVRSYNQGILTKYSNNSNMHLLEQKLIRKYNPQDIDHKISDFNFETFKNKIRNSQCINKTNSLNNSFNNINNSSGKKIPSVTNRQSNQSSSNKRSSYSRNTFIYSDNFNNSQGISYFNIGRNSNNSQVRSDFTFKRNHGEQVASSVLASQDRFTNSENINEIMKNPKPHEILAIKRKIEEVKQENISLKNQIIKSKVVKMHANQTKQFDISALQVQNLASSNIQINCNKNEKLDSETNNNLIISQSQITITQLSNNFKSKQQIETQTQIITDSSSTINNFDGENKENLAYEITNNNLHKVEEAKEYEESSPAINSNIDDAQGSSININNFLRPEVKNHSICNTDSIDKIIVLNKSRSNSVEKNQISTTTTIINSNPNFITMTNISTNSSARKTQNLNSNNISNNYVALTVASVKKLENKDVIQVNSNNINQNNQISSNLEKKNILTSNSINSIPNTNMSNISSVSIKNPESKTKTDTGNKISTSNLNTSNMNISNMSNISNISSSSSSSGILTSNSLNNTVSEVVELSNNTSIKETISSESHDQSQFHNKNSSSISTNLNNSNINVNASVTKLSSKVKPTTEAKDNSKTQVENTSQINNSNSISNSNSNCIPSIAPQGIFNPVSNQPNLVSNNSNTSNSNNLVSNNNPFIIASNDPNIKINKPFQLYSNNSSINNSSTTLNSVPIPLVNPSNSNKTNDFKNLFRPVSASTNNNNTNPFGGNIYNPIGNNNMNFLNNNNLACGNTISNSSPQSISSTLTFGGANVNTGYQSTVPNTTSNNIGSNSFAPVASNLNYSSTGNNLMYNNSNNNFVNNHQNKNLIENNNSDMPIDNSPPKNLSFQNNSTNSYIPNSNLQGHSLNSSFNQQARGVNYYNNNYQNQVPTQNQMHSVKFNSNPFGGSSNQNQMSSVNITANPFGGSSNQNQMSSVNITANPFQNNNFNTGNNPGSTSFNSSNTFNPQVNNNSSNNRFTSNSGWPNNTNSSNFNSNSNFNSLANQSNHINPNPFLSSGQNQRDQRQGSIFDSMEPSRRKK